jgi:hypothetical protein
VLRAASVVLAVALVVGLPLHAQVLYKWTDDTGRVQYSDKPPKNFMGEITRIEPDVQPATAPPWVPPAAASAPPTRSKEPEAASKAAPQDMATKRRTTRDALALRLEQARENLAQARRALDAAGGPSGPEESQVVQQIQTADAGGMHGLSVQRSNCSPVVGKDGKAAVMCPALVPNDFYFDRVSKLEEAVKRAEVELDAAEQAYRRGVD